MWNFDRILYFPVTNPTDFTFDGCKLFVVSGTSIHVLDYRLQENNNDNQALVREENYEITEKETFTIPTQGHYITYVADHVYVSDGAIYDKIYKVNTTTGLVNTITLPQNMDSNIGSAGHRLWFVGDSVNTNDRQELHWLDLFTNAFGKSEIPVRKQLGVSRVIEKDYQEQAVVADFNNVSISVFDIPTGGFVATHRLTREITSMYPDKDRTFYFAGSAILDINQVSTGIASSVNTITGVQGTNHQIFGDSFGIGADNGNIWFGVSRLDSSDKIIGRIKTSDQNVLFSGNEQSGDHSILEDKFKEVTFNKMKQIPSFEWVYWNADTSMEEERTTPSYIWLLSNNYIQGFEVKELYNTQYRQVESTAMLSIGPDDYTGD